MPSRRRAARASSSSREAASICSTGMSRAARSGSRCRRSVASSAASESLSIRTARASGCVRIRSIAASVPAAMPACGPPSSLSAEKHTTSAPASMLVARGGLVGEQRARGRRARRASTPEPRSSISARPRSRASVAKVGQRGLLGEPDGPEVGGVHAHQAPPCPARSRARSRRCACGSWCRPRPGAHPTPRGSPESGTSRRSRPAGRARSRPRARARARRARAAPRPRCCSRRSPPAAPVSSRTSGSTCAWRLPRVPASSVVLEVRVAAGRAVDRLERLERRAAHDRGWCGSRRPSR